MEESAAHALLRGDHGSDPAIGPLHGDAGGEHVAEINVEALENLLRLYADQIREPSQRLRRWAPP
ncbi:MAG: hypothetical protein HYV63_02430 [Candidatus Schekmanbacteria bacterium]|nr:hypothetical protein [Candidatus Schekmanbacteria bacterium]